MKPGTLVKLARDRNVYEAVTVAKPGGWYRIKPKQIGMFIRLEERLPKHGKATPGIFLFEEKLVSAYLEVFEPLEESG